MSPEARRNRATALTLASICVIARKGEPTPEDILAQADEFLQYITGDDDAQMPRIHDKRVGGKLPR